MNSFHSPLQAVRTVRERDEQQALQEYIRALRVLDEAKAALATVERELITTWAAMRAAILQGGAAAGELARLQTHAQALSRRRADREAALQTARARANRAFVVYLAAHQSCAVVEQCLAHQKRRHLRARRRREQKALDDLAQRGLALAGTVLRSRGTLWN